MPAVQGFDTGGSGLNLSSGRDAQGALRPFIPSRPSPRRPFASWTAAGSAAPGSRVPRNARIERERRRRVERGRDVERHAEAEALDDQSAPASVALAAQPTFHAMLLKLVARARRPCGSTSMVNACSSGVDACMNVARSQNAPTADRQAALAAERDQERQRQQLEPTAERSCAEPARHRRRRTAPRTR